MNGNITLTALTLLGILTVLGKALEWEFIHYDYWYLKLIAYSWWLSLFVSAGSFLWWVWS